MYNLLNLNKLQIQLSANLQEMNLEGDSKGGNLRLAQVRKPEFTVVNEDFRGKRNAKFTLLSRPLQKDNVIKMVQFMWYKNKKLAL